MCQKLLLVCTLSLIALGVRSEPISARQAPAATQITPESLDRSTAAPLMRQGRALSAQQASELEVRLEATPDDLSARLHLLGYYFNDARAAAEPAVIHAARRRHILWMIEHHAENNVTRSSELTIDPAGHALADAASYDDARKVWLDQIARRQGDVQVRSNAAWFFRLNDKELAINTLKQALQVAPDNVELAAALGYMYGLTALGITMMNQNGLPTAWDATLASGEFATAAAKEVRESSNRGVIMSTGAFLAQRGGMIAAGSNGAINRSALTEELLTRAAAMDPNDVGAPNALIQFYRMQLIAERDPAQRSTIARKQLAQAELVVERTANNPAANAGSMITAAKAAIDAEVLDRAQRHATDLLKRLSDPPTQEEGPAFHDGHVVLGRVALKNGDVAQARAHLLKAGQTPGGGTLTSFGPNMTLAKELAERGEMATVIMYLESCRSFWKRPQLDVWIQSLKDGKVPAFGPNLNY